MTRLNRRSMLALAPAVLVGGTAASMLPAAQAAAATMVTSIVQEAGDDEARFPDILKRPDGTLMAVWQQANAHSGDIGVIRVADGSSDGRTWGAPRTALVATGPVAGKDQRDPKIGLMLDGTVVLTFFIPGGKVYYSVRKPDWKLFTEPKELVVPGATAMYTHGPPLALAAKGTHTTDVLVPFYTTGTTGGAWFVRTEWDSSTNTLDVIEPARRIITNSNPAGRAYQEPNIVQFGDTAIAVVRAEQDGGGSPAIIAWWNAYATVPSYTYQSFTGVLANSHHLLKTSDNKILFTYGDKSKSLRPTVGMLIDKPTEKWVAAKVVPIYNSGAHDQANPSSVETSAGTYLTLGYNAKTKAQSPTGGTLWVIQTKSTDY